MDDGVVRAGFTRVARARARHVRGELGLSRAGSPQTTYPRFLSLPKSQGGALLLDLRTGISGLGDEWLFVYTQGAWRSLGVYLQGVQNNA